MEELNKNFVVLGIILNPNLWIWLDFTLAVIIHSTFLWYEWQFVSLAGIEWSLDNDASNASVLVASEAHAITLAIEGLLGVVFTVATLTDEAVDVGEV